MPSSFLSKLPCVSNYFRIPSCKQTLEVRDIWRQEVRVRHLAFSIINILQVLHKRQIATIIHIRKTEHLPGAGSVVCSKEALAFLNLALFNTVQLLAKVLKQSQSTDLSID
jgi:hypothetical protein